MLFFDFGLLAITDPLPANRGILQNSHTNCPIGDGRNHQRITKLMKNILFDNTLLKLTREPMETVANSRLDESHFSS